jgi:hypothetical protein
MFPTRLLMCSGSFLEIWKQSVCPNISLMGVFSSCLPEKDREYERGDRDDVIEVYCVSRRCISEGNVVQTRNCESRSNQQYILAFHTYLPKLLLKWDMKSSVMKINNSTYTSVMEINNSTYPTSALVKIHMNAFNLSSFNLPLHITKCFLLNIKKEQTHMLTKNNS